MPVELIRKNKLDFAGNVSASAQLLLLTELENKIDISQNIFVAFYNSYVAIEYVIYDKLEMIVSQNANTLAPGDSLAITAGHGLFSNSMHEKVQIGGSVLPVGETGFVKFKIKMHQSGTYSVPVVLTFQNTAGHQISKTVLVSCEVK